jgi:hypothetical protein
MRSVRCFLPVALLGLLTPAPSRAASEMQMSLPAAGGLAALGVSVGADGAVRVATCMRAPCPASTTQEPIARLAPGSDVRATPIAIGEGRAVLHLHAKVAGGGAWEAILAGQENPVIFAGRTGLFEGQEGERTGTVVQILPRDEDTKYVIVADAREDLRICGQEATPLSPRALDPKTLTLRGATIPRISGEQRAAAKPIVAVAHVGDVTTPLAPLLVAAGASTAVGAPAALVDGDRQTTWSEGRPGDGHGEFVLLHAPAEVPIARLTVIASATKPSATSAAPRTFHLVSGDATYLVTLPEDALRRPGQAWDVPLPQPLKSSCLAIVLEEAYARTPAPDVSIAEIVAYSSFDTAGASLADVARALGAGGPRAAAAAGVLRRAGKAGLEAAAAAYPSLDASGRALAVEVATSSPCEVSGPVLVAALGDVDGGVLRKARGKLERCGKAAAPALLARLSSGTDAERARVAPLAALLAPGEALAPLVAALGTGDTATRAAIREATARAARTAPPETLAPLLADAARPLRARLELLRALSERLPELAAAGRATLEAVLGATPDLATRWLAIAPLAVLAADDAALAARLSELATGDPDWPVRARALELGGRIPAMRSAIERGLADAEPRVREAALRASAEARLASAVRSAAALLEGDDWTFVREAGAAVLIAAPPDGSVDASIARSLAKQPSPRVRVALLRALGERHATTQASAVLDRLEERDELPDVRVAAATALGAMCARDASDALTKVARAPAAGMATMDELTLAEAAVLALGELRPADLRERLAPLLDKSAPSALREAAERALSVKGGCR